MGSRDINPIPRNERGGTDFLIEMADFQRGVIAEAMKMLENGEDVVGAEIARRLEAKRAVERPNDHPISARMVTNILNAKKWKKYKARYVHTMTNSAMRKRVIMACQLSALIYKYGYEVLKYILFR